MKHLRNYITESDSIQALKDKLIQYLNDKENVFTEKNLKRALQILKEIDDTQYKQLEDLYAGNIEGLECVIDILEKYGNKENFLKALLTKEGFPEFKDLGVKNNTISDTGNLLTLVKEKKFKLSELFDTSNDFDKFLTALLSKTYRVSGKNIGAGELFLTTLFRDSRHPNRSDVNIAEKEMEVKFSSTYSRDGGRLIPAKNTLCSVKEISEFFEGLLNEKEVDLSGISRNKNGEILIAGKDHINKLIDYLESKELDRKTIVIMLAKMYFHQFINLQNKKDEFDQFVEEFFKDNACSYDNLIKIHGCLALMSYNLADEWEYLLVGVLQDGKYCIIKGEKCSIDNFSENLNNLIKDCGKNFTFKNYPSNTDGAQPMLNKACQIYVVK